MLRDASTTLGIGVDVVNGTEGKSMSIVCTTEDMHMSWPLSLTMMVVDAWWIVSIRNSSIPFGDSFQ